MMLAQIFFLGRFRGGFEGAGDLLWDHQIIWPLPRCSLPARWGTVQRIGPLGSELLPADDTGMRHIICDIMCDTLSVTYYL